MLRHLDVRRVEPRIVSVRMGHGTAELVRHRQRRYASEVIEGSHVRADEVGQCLGARGLRVRVVARAQHDHKQLDIDHLAGRRVHDHRLLARVVNEGLLARAVHLAHRRMQPFHKGPVQLAELAVLVAGGVFAEWRKQKKFWKRWLRTD